MRIAIADDHPIFRSGLRFLLEASFPELEIIEFENGSAISAYCLANIPDIVILDIDMPAPNGLEVCSDLRKAKCETKIIILTMYNDPEMLKLAFYNGADGYVVKDNTSEELVDCIHTILSGKSYLAKSIRESEPYFDTSDNIAELLGTLTRTELKTLKLVSQKLSSKEIADLMFVSVKSVENYRSRICKKLNLDARNNSLLLWVLDHKSIIDGIK